MTGIEKQRIVSGDLFTEDWVLECAFRLKSGERCGMPATSYIERHMLGTCRHPALNSAGNLEAFVCDHHTAEIAMEAEKLARRYRPLPWWIAWLRDPRTKCPSCQQTVQTSADILQVVQPLSERDAA